MFAMAARRLGYRVHTLAPDHDTPTGQIADVEINASYDDIDAVRAFAQAVDVVTFEFENVSAAAVAEAEQHAIVRPNGRSLAIAQHRLKEKTFLAEHGLPVAPFAPVRTDADLAAAVDDGRLSRGAEDGDVGLRRQGTDPDREARRPRRGVGRARPPRSGARSVRRSRSRDLGDRRARRRRRVVALRPDRERARAPHPRRVGGAGERARGDRPRWRSTSRGA